MTQKGITHILLLALLAVVLITIIGFSAYKNVKENTSLQSSAEVANPEDIYGFSTPSLPEGSDWIKIGANEQILNNLLWHTHDRSISGKIYIPGTEWATTKSFNNKEEADDYYSDNKKYIYQIYRNELFSQEWKGQIPSFSFEKYEFSTADFAGVGCGSEGFFKVIEGKTQIIYTYQCMDKKFLKGSDPSGLIYPNTKEFRIFESEIVPLEDLVRKINGDG